MKPLLPFLPIYQIYQLGTNQLVTQNELMVINGQFLSFIVNTIFINVCTDVNRIWRFTLRFGIIPAVFLFIGMYFVPESPDWLLIKIKLTMQKNLLEMVRANKKSCGYCDYGY